MGNRYFMDLKYSIGDEDTSVELGILPENARHVMAVAGSGARVVPLLARSPKKLTCVDLQEEQLALTELRIEALRRLNHADYVSFLGYQVWSMTARERRHLFETLSISRQAKEYLGALFENADWGPIVYLGNYERSMRSLSQTISSLLRGHTIQIFECDSLEQQQEYFRNSFPKWTWSLILRLIALTAKVNSIIYKGVYPSPNRQPGTHAVLSETFSKLICQIPARKSFYLQLMLLGELVHPEGNPIECDAQIYDLAARSARKTEICLVAGDVFETVEKSVDFLSLSDVPSYLEDQEQERTFNPAGNPTPTRIPDYLPLSPARASPRNSGFRIDYAAVFPACLG